MFRERTSGLLNVLVENAIKHGMRTSATPLRVRVTVRNAANRLMLEVSNTGQWIDPAISHPNCGRSGRSLQLMRERLQSLLPGRHATVLNEKDGWVNQQIGIDFDE